MACFDEGMVEFLDNNNKDDFDVGFLLANPLGYIIEITLGRKCIVHRIYMK